MPLRPSNSWRTAIKMNRKISYPHRVRMAALILAIMAAATPLLAQPVIENAIYYTDFWYDNPLGWPTGHHFVACAKVKGANPITVEAEDQRGGIVSLPHDHGNWYCRFVEGELIGGVLRITATDVNGASAKKQSTHLDQPRIIRATRNIDFSNETVSPAIFWDPNMDAEGYYVRIYQTSTQKEIFRSPPLSSTTYQLPGPILNAGTSYVFRILAHDYDACDQHVSGLCVENRSSTFSREFVPRTD